MHANPAAIAALRTKPGPPEVLPSHFRSTLLKHSDEQTVLSVAAVLTAIHRFQLAGVDFSSWGVVAAPRWLGRPKSTAALNRFHNEGLPAASPMLVPHLSLHAVSGTISQVLRIHGPNLGVGSGIGHLGEGLLAAVALMAEGRLPGLWLTLSQWDPEPAPDRQGQVPAGCVCSAVALALQPLSPPESGAGSEGPRLRLLPPAPLPYQADSPPDVRSLAAFLGSSVPGSGWLCPLAWGGWVELTGVPGEARP